MIKVDKMTDAQVVLRASCHGVGPYHLDGTMRQRLESIARDLDARDRKVDSR